MSRVKNMSCNNIGQILSYLSEHIFWFSLLWSLETHHVSRDWSGDCPVLCLFDLNRRLCAFELWICEIQQTPTLGRGRNFYSLILRFQYNKIKAKFTHGRWNRGRLQIQQIVFIARAKTVELKLYVKLPLKRQRPISPQNLSSFFFSCLPKIRTLSHCVRTGRGLSCFDTAFAYLIYYSPLGWPSFKA